MATIEENERSAWKLGLTYGTYMMLKETGRLQDYIKAHGKDKGKRSSGDEAIIESNIVGA